MRQKLVVGNWKLHGSLVANQALLKGVLAHSGRARLAVCVPFPYLGQAQEMLSGSAVAWGAQDLSAHASGAFTGEVSAAMLADFACKYVIVGHSERRAMHGESDAVVVAKSSAALAAGLTPIICFGETLAERESGITEQVLAVQIDALVSGLGAATLSRVVLAYEPVWAIGTGRTASVEQAQAVHAMARGRIAAADMAAAADVQILYGGSVKPANAAELFAAADIDGGLIGGASLVAADFLAIANAV